METLGSFMTSVVPRHATGTFKPLLNVVAMATTFMSNSDFLSIPNLGSIREILSSFKRVSVKLLACDWPYQVLHFLCLVMFLKSSFLKLDSDVTSEGCSVRIYMAQSCNHTCCNTMTGGLGEKAIC